MLSTALNLLFPPRCLTCEEAVSAHGTLCAQCWSGITFLSGPCCGACGLPFDFDMGEGALCAECLHRRPVFSRARAALRYDDASRRLIMELKYQDETQLARIFGPWMASAGRDMAAACDIIVPVPLHYWRFVKRRYNQAALLAQALAKPAGLPVLPDALLRTRATPQQAGLSKRERERNMRGAFRVNPRYAERLRGKSVLLIDDVFTTGATLSACTRSLLAAQAASVSVLTLARRL